MTSLRRDLLSFALVALTPTLGGCPASTGRPPAQLSDLSASADLAGARFDLSVPDLASPGDLRSDLTMVGDTNAAVPGDSGSLADRAAAIDQPAPLDAPPVADAGLPDARPDDAGSIADAGSPDLAGIDGGQDGGQIADQAMPSDLACLPLASFTNGQGFVGGNNIGLTPNVAVNVAAGQAVTIIAWTTPSGAKPAVNAIYAVDAQFMTPKSLPFTHDAKPQGNPPPNGTDQWFVVLPAQAAGTHVWVYLRADICDKKSLYLPGNANYEYIAR